MIPVLHGVWAAAGGLVGDFEHIETQTVGAGGAASVTFSSIPGTYKHLQMRGVFKQQSGTTRELLFRANSDTGNNYAWHQLIGDGSAASSVAGTSTNLIYVGQSQGASPYYPGATVTDVLNYTSTSKYKTVRSLWGWDANSSGTIRLASGVWMNTAAITAITLILNTGNMDQYSSFSLYGVK